jgi:hypothetical protein
LSTTTTTPVLLWCSLIGVLLVGAICDLVGSMSDGGGQCMGTKLN